ncbi:MAG TPA: hypothetical protein VHU41_19795 [Thermoanaerobaculia bacterium]|jgi:hypothetical protein|nr:hypothetical protein [Thermoanaerobaculia bacterium]
MRKLLGLVFLLVIAAAVWLGARAFVHRGEVKATIVFDDVHGLRRGDPVVEHNDVAGRVTSIDPLGDRSAVTIRLDRMHRRSVLTDSLFAVDHNQLVVTNTFAVGRPIDDGALLEAKEDRVSRWLAKHGGAVEPFVNNVRARADELIDKNSDAAKKLKERVDRSIDNVTKK